MNVILFGATGMVGQGVLLECLDDPEVKRVVSVVRRPTGVTHMKLTEIVHADFFDYTAIEPSLRDADACFFCLGVSSVGMKEEDYRHITYDLTMAAAQTLHRLNPNLAFIYVSGTGTDSTEAGRTMWARVKGKTENDLTKLFARAYMFRPGYIHPEKGVRSRTRWVHVAITVLRPVGALLKRFPGVGTSSDVLGRAMIAAVRSGAPSHTVEIREINTLGAR
ncbi:MAG TPA: NAD(P)H-binding protein [Polyangia bacterium]|jgi:uncharacterized protein YbjT (DUF2867 family)|nr:NAD(P)H-binding protein [Polyangia bacterium]